MFRCLMMLLMVALTSVASAITSKQKGVVEDTLTIRFRMDSIYINMDYADNRQAWNQFEQNFYKHFSNRSPRALQLDIYRFANNNCRG